MVRLRLNYPIEVGPVTSKKVETLVRGPQSSSSGRKVGKADEQIGGMIRAARLASNVTQEELAGLLGLSTQQLQKYEAGSNRVTVSRMMEIADALDVGLFEILSDHKPGAKSQAVASLAEALELLSAFNGIQNSDSRRKILELAAFLYRLEENLRS